MKTLADYPHLCAQLHTDNESGLQPAAISYGSNKKLLWKCPVADDHVWKTSVKERAANGRGCPFCSGKHQSTIELGKSKTAHTMPISVYVKQTV